MILTVAALLIGTLCVFLGYRLLMRGIYAEADSKAVWSNGGLLIKRGAPGVIFAVFGAAMIVLSLMHSKEFRTHAAPAAAIEAPAEQADAKSTPSAQQPKRKLAREQGSKPRPPAANTAQPAFQRSTSPDGDFTRDDVNETPPVPKAYKPGRA
jgi:hypothetical protein